MFSEIASGHDPGHQVVVVWEAVSAAVMIVWGTFTALGLFLRRRWFGWSAEDNVYRMAGIIFGVCLSLFGIYLLGLALRGYVVTRGAHPVRFR